MKKRDQRRKRRPLGSVFAGQAPQRGSLADSASCLLPTMFASPSSTTTARRRLREAYKGRRAMHPTCGTPHPAGAPASRMRAAARPLPGLSRGRHRCCRRQATRPSCTATPEGTGRMFWPRAAGLSGTAPPGKGHSRPCTMSTGSRGPPRPRICRRTPGR